MYSLFGRLRQLILPNGALPNEPAIILGPDLPPCMRTRYAAAQFWRPAGTAADGINGRPWRFSAQQLTTSPTVNQVDEGWLIYDQTGVCGFIVDSTKFGVNAGAAVVQSGEIHGPLGFGGSATIFNSTTTFQHVGSPLIGISSFQIGASTYSPALSEFLIDNVSAPRGLRALTSSAASSAAIGAEAVVQTTPAMTLFNGRGYEVALEVDLVGTAAGAGVANNVRLTNLAGTLLLEFGSIVTAAAFANHLSARGYLKRVAGTDLAGAVFVNTLLCTAGTITQLATATRVRSFAIRDCGAAGDYPNAIAV